MPKNQAASIDGVGSIWSVIAKKTMRKRVSNVRSRHIPRNRTRGVRNVLRAITCMAWSGLRFFGLRGSADGWPAGGFRLSDFDGLAEKHELLRFADKARGLFVWGRRR
jgi:hypothetical protein